MANLPGTKLVARSAVEETDPLGVVAQGAYLNQMVVLETDLAPREMLAALQEIEEAEGRVRTVRWGPRTLDLDIVLIEGRDYHDDMLSIPHPELPNRDFWQRELDELGGAHRV
jgi:2-amino-4-hydroxy-6-hydroxymethyldihydropteridine diphosphokinase